MKETKEMKADLKGKTIRRKGKKEREDERQDVRERRRKEGRHAERRKKHRRRKNSIIMVFNGSQLRVESSRNI